MTRRLVGVPVGPPDRDQIIIGATPIDHGYPKQYAPDDFRSWAQDVDDAHRLMALDPTGVALARRMDEDPLLDQTYGRMFVDPNDGIKGSLEMVQGQRRVVLDGGRHRAHYQMERGWSVVPVWVRSDDPEELDSFRHACHSAIRQADPALADAYERTSEARIERNNERRVGRERDLRRERSLDRWERER